MNILFFCWEYPPNGSGIGRYVEEMSDALSTAGHSVTVLTSRADSLPRESLEGSVRVLREFDRTELRSMRVAELALGVARDCKADWIEAADHWGEGSSLLKCRRRPPVVVKMHYNDVLEATRYSQAWFSWQRAMIDLACLRQWRAISGERYSIRHADILLAPCRRILDEAEKQGVHLAANRAVVPNTIQPLRWKNAESQKPKVLLVGRLDIGKGLPYIRAMLEDLVPFFPELTIEIAGGDSYARGLGSVKKWFDKQLGEMREYVKLLGFLDQRQMDEAYQRAWVVIAPSRWDTFPQTVLEAMVRSKAIVSSPYGGMPEMLEGTESVIADPESRDFPEAVRRFLGDSLARAKAGKSVCDRVCREYNPQKVASAYIDKVCSFL